MRISDWSSEVCSSDLFVGHILEQRLQRDLVITVEREMLRDLALADRLVGRRNEVEDLLAAGQAGRNIRAFFHCPADISAPAGFTKRRSAEHRSEIQSLMRITHAVSCVKKKKQNQNHK